MINNIKEKLSIQPVFLNKNNVYGIEAEESFKDLTFQKTLETALKLKEDLGMDWKYKPGLFPDEFENYVKGWNAKDELYSKSKSDHKLLYLNLDLEDNGCTRRCSHCFTMSGQIDVERGRSGAQECSPNVRKKISKIRLIDQIAKAKDTLGLRAVRILGRGEPTESPYLLEFVEQMSSLGITTVIFTRGHVIGNDIHARKVYKKHGVKDGFDLVDRLNKLDASIILGYSAMDDSIHDGMTGIYSHSKYSREGLRRFVASGFAKGNPTRLGIEAPIAKINMKEMPISYLLFQCLGISPIYNTYMVTGRADQSFFDSNTPTLEERLMLHGEVVYYMRKLGIKDKVGPYLGTKECHDVSNGLYIPSSGDIRPCTGYESKESLMGDLNEEGIDEIWERSKITGKQHICPPKIDHGFPLNYEELLEDCIQKNQSFYAERYDMIIDKFGF